MWIPHRAINPRHILLQRVQKARPTLQRLRRSTLNNALVFAQVINGRRCKKEQHQELARDCRINTRKIRRVINLAKDEAGKDPPYPPERYNYCGRYGSLCVRNDVVRRLSFAPPIAHLSVSRPSDVVARYSHMQGSQECTLQSPH